jgi:hypothetical protein
MSRVSLPNTTTTTKTLKLSLASIPKTTAAYLLPLPKQTRTKLMRNKCLTIALILLTFTSTLYSYFSLSSTHSTSRHQSMMIRQVEAVKYELLNTTNVKDDVIVDYLRKYPFFLDCKTSYNMWRRPMEKSQNEKSIINYALPAPQKLHNSRITRALIVNFPIESIEHYVYEFKWLYVSWLRMQRAEASKWRTDLVVFVENEASLFGRVDFFLNELNCSFEHRRRTSHDLPMCVLIDYKTFDKRAMYAGGMSNLFVKANQSVVFKSMEDKYRYLLNDIDIFSNDSSRFEMLYSMMRNSIVKYKYMDSILIGFEGLAFEDILYTVAHLVNLSYSDYYWNTIVNSLCYSSVPFR